MLHKDYKIVLRYCCGQIKFLSCHLNRLVIEAAIPFPRSGSIQTGFKFFYSFDPILAQNRVSINLHQSQLHTGSRKDGAPRRGGRVDGED